MITNYFKITIRNILRHKVYAFINILGLAVGMACCILILLLVQHHLSYDRFHKNVGDIYRVIKEVKFTNYIDTWAITTGPLGPSLKKDFPDIIDAARIFYPLEYLLNYKEKNFYEKLVFTDGSLFEMFSFPLIKGNRSTALSDPYSIVLSEKMAAKYFGIENPLGKIITVSQKYSFQVTGVMKNIPRNSSLKADFFIPVKSAKDLMGRRDDQWATGSWVKTFVQLQKRRPYQEIVQKISTYLNDKPTIEKDARLNLQPFSKIHLYSNYEYDWLTLPNLIDVVIMLCILSLFILIIACVNFMNLATARSANRAREVGVRKVVGAYRSDIIKQFFGESILLAFLSLFIALLLVELMLPLFNNLTQSELSFDIAGNTGLLIGLPAITLITGIISGSYPALFLSSFQPVNVIKDTLRSGRRGSSFRKILIVFQFALTILLIVCTAAVYYQLNYMRNKDLGYDKEHILFAPIRGNIREKLEPLKKELQHNLNILGVTASASLLTRGWRYSTSTWDWEGKNPHEEIEMRMEFVDDDYLMTFGMQLVQGRNFSKGDSTDAKEAVLVNEKAVNVMRLQSPIGSRLIHVDKNYKIIGVVKNYHLRSLREGIDPLVLFYRPENSQVLSVKLMSENIPQTVSYVETIWKKFSPGYPFNYRFLDEALENLYRYENAISTILKYSSILAIFVACLGLFGLMSFMAEQRTKEICIRKAIGASMTNLVVLLSKEFLKCVLIANIIAWPIAFFLVHAWLDNYAYRTNISFWIFILAATITIVITLLTVSYQAVKAAAGNPVEALRYE